MNASMEKDLIALVHEGVIAENGWQALTDALRQAVGAAHANLTFRRTDAPMSDLTSYVSGGPTEDMSRFYFGGFHRTDPLPYYRLMPGRSYGLADIFAPDDKSAQDQLRLLLQPFGEPHLLILRITEPGGANAWLTVIRDTPEFSRTERELIEALGRHLGIALQAYVRLNDTQARLAAYTSAMGRLNVGIVTLTADGRIIDADHVVSRLLIQGEIMGRDPHGRLTLADGTAARALGAALRDFTRDRTGRSRAVRLSEGKRADMLLLPVAERPVTGPFTPVLRAYVHIDHETAGDSLESLMEMFRLTRSEAKLAFALCEGHTLAESAERLGVTLQTARTYSKRIFQKTGTRRQAELVRTLLTSTLSLV
ncbi:helix-turn-helix transcriptional regulator [Novosphingobium taihuense]|uniref:DNA-binding CsgD family transcriptional regulator/PAS domain-containing protein n=1 Tax=Novosphingobium taihuense TaxID=260085 RepID=A0A7W7EVG0_9SPHN|nr:helix-turn-helix transcriptional regulator [Novosphingobium taihuense]MBB4615034.1 DNA-binding CsgD family transcriptional regulator/PAS domain-containing protein [Novosphingobium taihuense]TWH84524.1 DNA-binding CsgD family transcriptional regulator [Novosphingobium taihuense]